MSEPTITHEARAAKWEPFELLRTVVEQSSSSLVTEALIVLERLESDIERLRFAPPFNRAQSEAVSRDLIPSPTTEGQASDA